MRLSSLLLGAVCLFSGAGVTAIELDLDDKQSIRDAASTVAYGLMGFYHGNNTGDVPGNLPDPYYWWKAGAMFGAMVDYWAMTGDDTYNDVTKQALMHQRGEIDNYEPRNQSAQLGNDDQGFWVMAVMSAIENNFPDPPEDVPPWLTLVMTVFNHWADRWDEERCGGGLRWQIFLSNRGWMYKNSISNGCFFNIAARLARYTGNDTYAEWATKIWNWEVDVGLIDEVDYKVRDGVTIAHDDDQECKGMDGTQWSYNAGIFLHGSAVMYNYTGEDNWRARTEGILNHSSNHFFNDSVMFERRCEAHKACDEDQLSFKGYLARWYAGTALVVPDLYDRIMALLRPNALGAASNCIGQPPAPWAGIRNTACGFSFTPQDQFDGLTGVDQQMNAMSAIMYTLLPQEKAPVTLDTGGTSRGDPGAGNTDYRPITTADRAGAGIITAIMALSVVGTIWFMASDAGEFGPMFYFSVSQNASK